MTTRLCLVASLALTLVFRPTLSHAQSTDSDTATVQDIVSFLVTNQGVQTNDFDRDREAAAATGATLTRALLAAMTRWPVGSASSGFVYRLNPSLGTVERATETFGPFFVERAHTSGAGQASAGFTLQYASFRSLDGHNLRDGALVTTANQGVNDAEPFDVETLILNISTRTATVFGSVGVTETVDVSAAIPLIGLRVNGTRLNTFLGQTQLQARGNADTSGVGDIALRGKVRLTPDGPAVAAAGVELWLPTGREEDLLGTGKAGIRFLGMGSAEAGPTNVYGNVGIGFGGIGREVSYSGAVAVAASPRVTIVGELLARHIFGLQRITPVSERHPRIRNVNTTRLLPEGEAGTSMFAVAGFKWNVADTWLLHGHVLLPLSDSGLTARFTPTVALDYAFGSR